MALLLFAGAVRAQEITIAAPAEPVEVDAGSANVQIDDGRHYAEGIISFDVNLDIEESGVLRVTERIKVYAAGIDIQRGIFRELPLTRKNKYGKKVKLEYKVRDVLKDGMQENFSTREAGNRLTIRIGNADVMLSSGVYEYTIVYETMGQIGFFDGFDEIYWNVTGDEWKFPIAKASATVKLPGTAKVIRSACYTGASGSTASNCSYMDTLGPHISTNGRLEPGEGFTIAVAFTPGIIKRPPPLSGLALLSNWFFNFKEYILAVLGAAILFWYFFTTWKKYGKDPEKPVIVPLFNPPGGMSPAEIRQIYLEKLDMKSMTAALVNMAVKKVIRIGKEGNDYEIRKRNNDMDVLSPEERKIYSNLLHRTDAVKVDQVNNRRFGQARLDFEAEVKERVKMKDYIIRNPKQMWRGGLLAAAVLIVYLLFINFASLFFLVFLLPFLAVGAACVCYGVKMLKNGCAGIFVLLFGVPFTLAPLVALFFMTRDLPPVATFFIFAVIAAYIFYLWIIPAPTLYGAQTMAEIEGFHMYMSVAEEHRLDMLTPPEQTPALFERLLPYAIALDLENVWGKRFKEVLESVGYEPEWYNGGAISYVHFNDTFSNRFSSSVKDAGKSVYDKTTGNSGYSSGSRDSSGWSSSGSSGSSGWSSGSSSGSSGGGGGGGGGGGW